MLITELSKRFKDGWGAGHYQASRGSRVHKGVDLMCYSGLGIHSHVEGVVTKIGYPYADDLSYRYVEVTSEGDLRHRFFYVEASVGVGDKISLGDLLGHAQDIQGRYKDRKPNSYMCNHIHYEILSRDGSTNNPGV